MSRHIHPIIRATIRATFKAIGKAQAKMLATRSTEAHGRSFASAQQFGTLASSECQGGFDEQFQRAIEFQVGRLYTNLLETYSAQLLGTSSPAPPNPPAPDYLKQIAAAQEFINENRNADLFQTKCLLRKMLPKKYHDLIESLKEQQDPQIFIQITGGNNIIAPKAKTAKQLQENQDRTVNDER